jgi:hypothetical protein
MFQKILFRRIEIWIVLIFALISLSGTVFFGWVVLHEARGGTRAGHIGEIAIQIAQFPSLVKKVLFFRLYNEHKVMDRFSLPAGFTYYPPHYSASKANYILVNRFDGKLGFSVSELIREGEGKPLAQWSFDNPDIYKYDVGNNLFQEEVFADPASMRATHSYIDRKGNLTLHFNSSPLYQIDKCSVLLWKNTDFAYHHSIEVDSHGSFWVPGRNTKPSKIEGFDEHFVDDHLVQIDAQGKTLFSKSITEILIENDLINRMYVYDSYQTDPIHLNDIQPVLFDGPHWEKGDVFLSLGHLNMIMLYRPQTNSLLWWSQEKIMHQHDIDILDNETITVYDNKRTTRASGDMIIGNNQLLYFHFPDQSITSPLEEEFSLHDVRTVNQGLADLGDDGSIFVEETNAGRLLLFTSTGEKAWEYVNKDDDGNTYTLNWCRYIPRHIGDAIVENLQEVDCDRP